MTIAMWFIVVGLALLTASATWLLGAFGLGAGGVVVLAGGLYLAPTTPSGDDDGEGD